MTSAAPTDADALRQLLDAQAIEQVWLRYFDRVDADDAMGAVADFADDAHIEIMTGRQVAGREAYARLLDAVLAQYASTSHHASNFVIEYIDDDTVTMQAYVYAYHRLRETGEPWHLWARIVDRMRRTPDGWQVVEHILHGVDSHPRWGKIDDTWYRGHPGRHERG